MIHPNLTILPESHENYVGIYKGLNSGQEIGNFDQSKTNHQLLGFVLRISIKPHWQHCAYEADDQNFPNSSLLLELL